MDSTLMAMILWIAAANQELERLAKENVELKAQLAERAGGE